MSEKWVAVEMINGFEGYEDVAEVHGIFDSKQAAEEWVRALYYGSYEIKRIRRAVTDEWA